MDSTAQPLLPRSPALPGLTDLSGAMRVVAGANLVLRFSVELATFASLAYCGASILAPWVGRVLLGFTLPLLAIVLWGLFLAPKAPRRLDGAMALGLELTIFGTTTLVLLISGLRSVAVICGAIAVFNSLLLRSLGQYRSDRQISPTEGRPR